MRQSNKRSIWIVGLVLLLAVGLWLVPASAEVSPWRSAPDRVLEAQAVVQDLTRSQVIYLGEVHDRAADHEAQFAILQTLHQQHLPLAIGMEMFQRPFQTELDRYLAGNLTEAQLRQNSEYDDRWGYDWEYYAPMLRFAQAQSIPVVALNTPAEVTRRVAWGGLEALEPADRQWIPPVSEIRLEPAAYRQRTQAIYEHIHQGTSASANFENFFLAQVLWDETMADRIASFLGEAPQRTIVVLAGQGHIAHGDGIPDRVARRVAGVNQRSVLLNPAAEELATLPPIADYFWASAGEE